MVILLVVYDLRKYFFYIDEGGRGWKDKQTYFFKKHLYYF